MTVLKLSISDFDAVDYNLIAIHTSLEDYRLAYFLNQKLPILLSKNAEFVELKSSKGNAFFSKFSYFNDISAEEWTLIENKDDVFEMQSISVANLFTEGQEKITSSMYLLPEMKKVSYLLKISSPSLSLAEIITKINTITQISTAYAVEVKNLKSKNNLIF